MPLSFSAETMVDGAPKPWQMKSAASPRVWSLFCAPPIAAFSAGER